MKKYTVLSIIFLAVIATFLFCGDDDPSDPGPDPAPNPAILTGTWEDTISFIGAGLQPTIVGIKLLKGKRSRANSFEIYSRDSATANMYYKHRGSWEIAGDSIKLTGSSIEMWDANGTAISDIPDSVASKVYTLDTTRTYDSSPATWGGTGNSIQIQHISCAGGTGVCLNIPFNMTFIDMVKSTNLNFEKK